ncbi:Intraflagellar transport protein 56 [Parelaphostrongylus tenuis]|uniref:Intraflagellar transport protein 56 n=1 Tax=Parelaphostrongylus tenuis TaxID=148309 RepID=A0AAD5MM24_PARTN|nr:Intraflagellar transport protein 56 [Parelaphostrongylus tenuis]
MAQRQGNAQTMLDLHRVISVDGVAERCHGEQSAANYTALCYSTAAFINMLLSRLRPAKKKQPTAPRPRVHQQIPDLNEFLLKRDYSAAISLLEFKQKNGEKNESTDLWLGHCYFRSGDYKKALDVYEEMKNNGIDNPDLPVYLGICFFYLGMYEDAKHAAEKGDDNLIHLFCSFTPSEAFRFSRVSD